MYLQSGSMWRFLISFFDRMIVGSLLVLAVVAWMSRSVKADDSEERTGKIITIYIYKVR